MRSLKVSKLNKIIAQVNKSIFQDNYVVTNEKCFPRIEAGKYTKAAKKEKPPWSIPISIFRDYKIDTEQLLIKCFEADWRDVKPPKLGDEEPGIKSALIKKYSLFKENYKVLAAIGRTNGILSIGWLTYNEFVCNKIKLVDGQIIKLPTSDILFKQINGRGSDSSNPMVSLVRYEFLEILFRIAILRYFDTKEVQTRVEAVEKLFTDHVEKYSNDINSKKWREERYWTEDVDNIYKANFSLLWHIYNTKGGKKVIPGEKLKT